MRGSEALHMECKFGPIVYWTEDTKKTLTFTTFQRVTKVQMAQSLQKHEGSI